MTLPLPQLTFSPRTRKIALLATAGGALAAALYILIPHIVMIMLSLAGLAAPLWLAGVLTTAAVVRWRGWEVLAFPWHRWIGAGLALVELQLVLALFRPAGWEFNRVVFEEVSLGGLLGQALLGPAGPLADAKVGIGIVLTFIFLAPHAARWLVLTVWGLTFTGLTTIGDAILAIYHRRLIPRAVMAIYRPIATLLGNIFSGFSVTADATDDDEARPTVIPGLEGELGIAPAPVTDAVATTNGTLAASNLTVTQLGDDEGEAPVIAVPGRWELPSMTLLEPPPPEVVQDTDERARQLETALASYGVQASVVSALVGPSVTQFGVEPGWIIKTREVKERDEFGRQVLDRQGNPKVHVEEVSRTRVKVERITGLSNDLALSLAAPSVRIEAPVPGKAVVGIEVPNPVPSVVALRSILESPQVMRMRARSKLAIALGKGVSGEPVAADLTRMPHLLIAGATGSGKSVCINTIIASLLMYATPDEVRLLMVDPKRVELAPYNDIPHLLAPVIVEADKVVGLLYFVLKEMDNRYKAFAEIGVRNIDGYNKSPKAAGPLPYWVVIIDELADLMMVAPFEVEKSLCRLAQLARATGIHLVVATQRPSVDVVTGLIKANFPSRIAFAVTSQVDSRTILDTAGAEKLLGRGDMLFQPIDASKPRRVQGTWVSEQEVERVVDYWTDTRWGALKPPQFSEIIEEMNAAASEGKDKDKGGGDDELLDKARLIAAETGKVSASLLQRRLRIGYVRAARLVEALKDEGEWEDEE